MVACRLNSLASIYYTLCATGLQLYLLYLAYARFHLYRDIRWPIVGGNRDGPRLAFSLYAALCFACAPLLLIFTIAGLFKTGNLGGDNTKLGANINTKRVRLQPRRSRNCLFRFLRSSWRHIMPIPASAHLAAALCQLIAQQLMIAQLYRYGFINSGDVMHTELDFIYQRSRLLATNLPMGDTRMQGFRITSEELAGSPLAPNLLPILMHARLFGIPLEFVNLCVALLYYCSSFASVFWALSKAFSILFTLYLLVQAVDVVFSYTAFAVLLRIHESATINVRPVGLGQYLTNTTSSLLYLPSVMLVTLALTFVCMHFTSMTLYAYGHCKYMQEIGRSTSCSERGHMPPMGSLLDECDGGAATRRESSGGCCDGYAPHLSAILLLLMIVTAKAPTLYALLLLHQNEPQSLFLSAVLVDVIYLFAQLALWFVLTIKRDWIFRLPPLPHVYKPNLTAGINPPPPANLFDTYRRPDLDLKGAGLYQPGSYASIRRPLRPAAGIVFAAGAESNEYSALDGYGTGALSVGKPATLRPSERPAIYLPTTALTTTSSDEPDDDQHLPAPPPATRPIIASLNYEQRPVLYGVQTQPAARSANSSVFYEPSAAATLPKAPLLTPNSQVSTVSIMLDPKTKAATHSSDLLTTSSNADDSQFASSIV